MSQPGSNQIDTGGGAYIGGSVNIGSGDFVGRDKVVHGDEVKGDKVVGHKAGGDVIVATVGAGAQNVAVGKNITQQINSPPTPAELHALEQQFTKLATLLKQSNIDPRTAGRAEAQLETLQAELNKTESGETPSGSTIQRVGDWLLDNVPELTQAITELFGLPAVGKILNKAGGAVVDWWRERFTPAAST